MTEDQLEQETLAWLQDVGYAVHSGFDLAPMAPRPARAMKACFHSGCAY